MQLLALLRYEPPLHVLHDVCAVWSWYASVPLHATHDVLPAALCTWPAAHAAHVVAPLAEYRPASQFVQYAAAAWSAPLPCLPAAHASHTAWPSVAWYCPAAQLLHAVVLAAPAPYLPLAHALHSDCFGWS